MFRVRTHLTPILAFGLALTACPKEKEDVKPPAEKEKPATEALTSSDPECITPWSTSGNVLKVNIGGRMFELQGAHLKETTNFGDDQAVFGVVANIKEDTPENMKNLSAIVEFFTKERVGAIIVDGDSAETEQQIVKVLEPIAAMNLPTFVIIGNLEKKSDYNNALKTVTEKHNNVFDLGKVRLVQLDDASLVSMPGYYDKSYLHAGEDGCNYKPNDVEMTRAIVKAAGDAKPLVLVSHGPPRQDGAEAIDRMSPGETNVGDPELMKLIRETGVKFGVFSNIQEAGGRGTNVEGTSLVGEGKMAPELMLNPGPADAVAWKMNDRTESVGMAATLTLKGKQASFKIFRAPAAAQ